MPVVIVVSSSSGPDTSVGSTVTLTATMTGNNNGYLLGTGGPAVVAFADPTTNKGLCAPVSTTTVSPGTLQATCTISNVDEYPATSGDPNPASATQFGLNAVEGIADGLSGADALYFVLVSGETNLTVVDPPTPAYPVPTTTLTMSAIGPCSPFVYVQGNDGAPSYADYPGGPTYPGGDMWGLQEP